ncbi:MAG: ethylbenzene dehydrogenase [Halieaceae bacterium]|nr:ethylbenzene dehydrogenase [Halieaceae bacterium]
MIIKRLALDATALADGRNEIWSEVAEKEIALSPAPLALTNAVSPYMSRTSGHGKNESLKVRMLHDGNVLSIRLAWKDPSKDDAINDLDQFADAAAVMFPMTPGASAFSMGSPDKAVNAWLWKADEQAPFDVMARGYATSARREPQGSGLTASGHYVNEHWIVVFQRTMKISREETVSMVPGAELAIAFALWEGSNNERSAQKSVSGEFVSMTIEH